MLNLFERAYVKTLHAETLKEKVGKRNVSGLAKTTPKAKSKRKAVIPTSHILSSRQRHSRRVKVEKFAPVPWHGGDETMLSIKKKMKKTKSRRMSGVLARSFVKSPPTVLAKGRGRQNKVQKADPSRFGHALVRAKVRYGGYCAVCKEHAVAKGGTGRRRYVKSKFGLIPLPRPQFECNKCKVRLCKDCWEKWDHVQRCAIIKST